jgi:hypothetical protein
MLKAHESAVAARPAAADASGKLLQLLRKRLRQLLRVTLMLAICLALAGVGLAIWRLTSLNGLPDIGDPFDVTAFSGLKIPDDENALAFLRRAQEKLVLLPELPRSVMAGAPAVAWSQADPKLRAWVEANRSALELFQQGADRPDGIWQPTGQLYWQNYPMVQHGSLMWVALLEGGRRQEKGDTAGAWSCYRAALRMMTHLRRRGQLDWRLQMVALHAALRQRLAIWAADPKTTVSQLRDSLLEATRHQPKPEWDAYTLKLEYLELSRQLEQAGDQVRETPDADLSYRLGDFAIPTELAKSFYAGHRFFMHEPERGQRALRRELAFACRNPRAQATATSGAGCVLKGRQRRQSSSLSRQSAGVGRRPSVVAARGGKLGHVVQRSRRVCVQLYLALRFPAGTAGASRACGFAGGRALSTRAWDASNL